MNTLKHTLLALSIAAALSACGGGAESPEPASREAFATAMRAKALSIKAAAVSAVTPTEAARQLMDFAESSFPALLPGHPTTLTYAGFVNYRVYASGIVLGVVVASVDPAYPISSVLVLGGPFGANPINLGPLTNFITPVDPNPDPGPVGGGNGCFDLSFADTQGTTSKIVYDYSGFSTGTQTVDTTVGALTTFEGQQARLVTAKTTGTNTTAETGSLAINTDTKSYQRKTGDAEITNYGVETTASVVYATYPATMSTRIVWNPPWVDRRYGLALGGSMNLSYSGTSTTSTTVTGLPISLPPTTVTTTISSTVKYLRQESVTVPAGTYNSCVYQETSGTGASTNTTTTWYIVGKGIPAQIISGSGSQQQTIKATSITVNGQKV